MMKALLLAFLTFPAMSMTQWKADLGLSIDGENLKREKIVFNPGKENTIELSRYQLKLSLQKNKQEGGVDVTYSLQEKKAKDMVIIARGTENIDDSKAAEIYAKGETGQPNSIITFKFHK